MAGPLEDLVGRIHRRIEAFASEHGLEQAMVEVELSDGKDELRRFATQIGARYMGAERAADR